MTRQHRRGIPSVFGKSLYIGDDTDYIRLNPSSGKIEYGGTFRPTIKVPCVIDIAAGTAAVADDYSYPLIFGQADADDIYFITHHPLLGLVDDSTIELKASIFTPSTPTGSQINTRALLRPVPESGTIPAVGSTQTGTDKDVSGITNTNAVIITAYTINNQTMGAVAGNRLVGWLEMSPGAATSGLSTNVLLEKCNVWVEYLADELPF